MSSQQNTTNNTQAEEPVEETFKDQLDRAATESRSPPKQEKPNPIVEKITEYVPAVANFLPGAKKEEVATTPKPDPSVPPRRPDHDTPIEEFVREQHRSKGGDEVLKAE